MRGKFDKLFQSDQSAWLKIAGGAILGPLFVIPMILRGEQRGEMEPYAYSDLFWIGVGASLFWSITWRNLMHEGPSYQTTTEGDSRCLALAYYVWRGNWFSAILVDYP